MSGACAVASGPLTGRAYIESLRDGRAVYLGGERVGDVTTHPALRNSVRSIARLYDALHDPARAGELTCATDTGSGTRTHRFFRACRSAEELALARNAIAGWARLTYGWMGRTPDYKASLTNTFGASPGFYGPFEDNARRWYRLAQERVPFLGHAVANPPIDRHLPPHEAADIPVRCVGETDAGIIVSGAKVVATSAVIATHCFVGQTPATASPDPDLSLCFIAAIDNPGVKLICRTSYEQAAARHGSPFDYPLSSRFDENDAILVFDRAMIPWEDVLIYRDPERVARFFPDTGFVNGFLFHGCTRMGVKLDFLTGLLTKALRCTGGIDQRGKRALLGELIAIRHAVWSLTDSMVFNPDPWDGGLVMPRKDAGLAASVHLPELYQRARSIIQQVIGSGLIYLPASASDLDSPEVGPMLEKYVRGSKGIGHLERIKVMKLLWDAVGSEFGGRHDLYERSYAGGWECVRLMTASDAHGRGRSAEMETLVDRCLAEYDEDGWTGEAWVAPERRTEAA